MENLNKSAVNNGLIIAIITIFIQLIVYYVKPALLGSIYFGFFIMLVSLGVYIFFTIDLRKKIGGYWTFREALKGIFLMALIAGVIAQVFNFVFYKYVEPKAVEKIAGYAVESMTSTFESMGMSEEQIDKSIADAEENFQSQYNPTLLQFFKTMGIAILIEFVMSLIFAAIFKKDPPLVLEQTE